MTILGHTIVNNSMIVIGTVLEDGSYWFNQKRHEKLYASKNKQTQVLLEDEESSDQVGLEGYYSKLIEKVLNLSEDDTDDLNDIVDYNSDEFYYEKSETFNEYSNLDNLFDDIREVVWPTWKTYQKKY